jgi:hypothetical protein
MEMGPPGEKEMTRHSKSDQFDGIATAYHQIKHGEMPHPVGAKDGSVSTHPMVPVDKTLDEAEVLAQCLDWLKRHKVFCNRLNNGKGDFGSGYATYGIIGAGDIIGLLPDGKHFEIEVKAGAGGRLSKVQQERQRDIVNNNGLYFIIHGLPELVIKFGAVI